MAAAEALASNQRLRIGHLICNATSDTLCLIFKKSFDPSFSLSYLSISTHTHKTKYFSPPFTKRKDCSCLPVIVQRLIYP